jgi:hypothetical protein
MLMNPYKFLFFLALLVYCSLASAQSLKPSVIASGGRYATGSNIQLSYTVGETMVTTRSQGSVVLTQGFQQTYKNAVGVPQLAVGVVVNVFPNPTTDRVNLLVKGENTSQYTARLYSLTGQLLQQTELTTNEADSFELGHLADGLYIIQLVSETEAPMGTYRIEKIS